MTTRGRRFQRGTLVRTRTHWVLRVRSDVERDGHRARLEQRVHVGPVAELPTRALARAAADRIADELTGRQRVAGRVIGAEAYLHEYLQTVVPLLRRATRANVRSIVSAHLLPLCRGRRLDEITATLAQTLVGELAAQGRAASTCRSIVKQLRALQRSARRAGYAVSEFDARAVMFPKRERAGRIPQTFTLAEVRQVIAYAPHPWRTCYALSALLGLRIGETLGLAWSDIDFATRVVCVRRAAVLGGLQLPKTDDSAARLPLSTALADILTEYRAVWRANPEGLLFATRTDRPLYASYVRRRLRRDLLALGLPPRGCHAFRRFAASIAVNEGTSLSAARDLLRHSSSVMTNTYLLTVDEDVRRAADQIGALIVPPDCGNPPPSTHAESGDS